VKMLFRAAPERTSESEVQFWIYFSKLYLREKRFLSFSLLLLRAEFIYPFLCQFYLKN